MKRYPGAVVLVAFILVALAVLPSAAQEAPKASAALSAMQPEQEDAELALRGIPSLNLTREERREMLDLKTKKEEASLTQAESAVLSDLIAKSTESAAVASPENIGAGTYAFTNSTGASLEDMTSGTTPLVAPNQDDTVSAIADIGFDFWFDGVRYRHFSANANGLMRLGTAAVSTAYTNDLASTTNVPQIAPYWDDLYTGPNGKVHFKVLGAAPNRKLVVEWANEQIPRVGAGTMGAATFQAWLYERTGVIEFVYGPGIAANLAKSGYSVGFGSSGTSFASVTTAGPTVAYGVANNAQTTAIAAGAKYTFTPNVPAAPTNLTFSAVGPTGMTLNWLDNSSDEVGFAIYRSTSGGSNWDFYAQVAAGATTYTPPPLNTDTDYTWQVFAVTEGALSAGLIANQFTTPGTTAGTFAVGPTGAFPTLTAALAAIGGSGIAGPIILELEPAYTSAAEVFPITIGNASSSATSPILIRPQAGAAGLLITSANTTATLDLNGAAGVIIDGRPGGLPVPSQLTIENTSASGPAVRFINDAIGNTMTFTTLRGVNTGATSGVVFFSNTTGILGNDKNAIQNCDIRDGATTPANLVYSAGSAAGAVQFNSANSGNILASNNIFNFFQAGAASQGVNLQAGNTNWEISGNHFYQTAPRVCSGAATHSAILVNTAGPNVNEGTLIAENFIGGSAPGVGGAAWTLSGAVASRFVGVHLANVAGTPASVQGNMVANFNWSTTSGATGLPGIWCGLYVAGGFAYIGTNSPNVVGSGTGTGSVTVTTTTTGGVTVGIGSASTTGALIASNAVGSITTVGSGTLSSSFVGIWGSASNQYLMVLDNVVGSTATANSINASSSSNGSTGQAVTGILNSGSSSFAQIADNTVANMNNNYAGTAPAGQIRGIATTVGCNVITGNTVRNLATTSLNTGTGTAASVLGIAQGASSSGGQLLSQNTVHSLSNTAAATTAVSAAGIYYTGTTGTNLVARNFVHSLSLATTSTTAYLYGIHVGGGTTTYQNNMVRLGIDAAGAAITTDYDIRGIYDAVGTNNYFFNSVYVGGAGVGAGATNSYAFHSAVTVNPRIVEDNIFVNERSNGAGTGRHVAALYSGTLPGLTGLTSNYNIYLSNGTGSALFQNVGTYYTTLAAWRTASGQDANSIELVNVGQVSFINPLGTSATVDLHLTGTTAAEQAGLAVASVTNDFDGEARAGLTPTDVGADAGNFTPLDLSGPTITYTPLGNTASVANRAFANVTITDASGVNTTPGTMPRVYYKRSTDGNVWNDNTSGTDGWKYAEANGASSPFDFTIDYSLLNGGTGVTPGTVVQYFVVAQDLAATPNVGINSGAFAAQPASVALTAAAFPLAGIINSYYISMVFSGTYLVPGSFPSLTNAGGLFEALNAGVLSGDVIVDITADLTGETGAVALNQLAETGAGGWTLLIRPSGAARAITGTGTSANLIKLNGADRVTFDGSLSGGTDRSLTISNGSTSTSAFIFWLASTTAPNGATGNTIKNCIINGNAPTTTFAGIVSSGSVLGSVAEAANSNNTYQNNAITAVYYGIGIVGPTGNENGNVITGNQIGSSVAGGKIGFKGIAVFQQAGATVSNNTILGVVTSTNNTTSGIYVAGTANGISIAANRISDIKNTNTSGYGANGIQLNSGSTAADVTVSNNFIWDVAGYGYNGIGLADNGYGIILVTGGGYKLYYNSVRMTTDQTAVSGIPAAVNVTSGITTAGSLDFRDNLFADTQTVGTRYAIYCAAASTVFSNIDYNDYYPGTGTLGYLGATRATLAAWQTATGQDVHSISADPLFVSTTDLHLQPCPAVSPAVGMATPIAGITGDIDGDARSVTTPDMGADETPRFTIAASAGTGGAINPTGSVTVACGASAGFTITPDPCYAIADVLVDGSSVGAVPTYTFPNVQANHTIAASFTAAGSFTIVASAGTGGSISPSGNVNVTCGADQSFSIAPSPGYVILDVLVDGSTVGAVPSYTFTNVQAGHTIAASFLALVGVVPDGSGTSTPFTVLRNAGDPSHLDLAWGDSCGAGQTDFAVYEGTVGTWYSHASILCSTGGSLSVTDVTPAPGATYYLIVPVSATAEGSYGTDSSGTQIPQGTGACFTPWDTVPCP